MDAGEDDRRGIRLFVDDEALGRRLMRLVDEVNGAVHLATWAIEAAAGIPLPPAA